ncbi:AraC-like DNA-binding protein [Silvimonas terrae]|uniref:AraC-like DNA-binding protein n=1 Tax=Silvimonas terrae TaxID=300266 RepID=A0A840RK35_9NEIS|nr:helix-turn-helix domain-containing protein [Silvimonas terrae]MBB5192840.1 AraC-like DNA-binding protein [Silvimonas terrae]
MSKNPDSRLKLAKAASPLKSVRTSSPGQGRVMREHLAAFGQRLASASQPVVLPPPQTGLLARGDGHFHLAPELFLQVSGTTTFRFVRGELTVRAGELLLMPPRLLHAEHVEAAGDEPFCNVVIYAEGPALTCHLAREVAPGKPGIEHLEAHNHAEAPHIHGWLADAARLARNGAGLMQTRALLTAATLGVLQALDDEEQAAVRAEPPLVAHARVLIQNRLGDQALSVQTLAADAGCTADYLSHLFRQSTGEHLAGFINRLRMERATHLLQDPALAGKEIAWACGFATASYFTRTFRLHFGMTPQAWRQARVPG